MAVVSGQVKMKLLNLLFLLSTKFGKKITSNRFTVQRIKTTKCETAARKRRTSGGVKSVAKN